MTSAETVTLDVEENKLTLTSTVPERFVPRQTVLHAGF
jgi:hypothetical protein